MNKGVWITKDKKDKKVLNIKAMKTSHLQNVKKMLDGILLGMDEGELPQASSSTPSFIEVFNKRNEIHTELVKRNKL